MRGSDKESSASVGGRLPSPRGIASFSGHQGYLLFPIGSLVSGPFVLLSDASWVVTVVGRVIIQSLRYLLSKKPEFKNDIDDVV